MPQWHSDANKRKSSGGKKRLFRKKRIYEMGYYPVETRLGDSSKIIMRTRGGNLKTKLLIEKYVNILDPSKNITERLEIIKVVKNPANVDYDRRNIVTKGTIIDTSLG
jgi:small subunit ribosomal protein S8e